MTIPAWAVWVLVAFFAIDAIGKVSLIGVPRELITKGQAAFQVFCSCTLIVVLALWVTG